MITTTCLCHRGLLHSRAGIISRLLLPFRRTIVTQISPTTSLLRSDTSDNEVYLLGTAHISQASANEVRQLAHVVKPKTIFIELDPARAAKLRAQEADGNNNEDDFERMVHEALQNFGRRGGMPFPPLPGFPGGGGGSGGSAGQDDGADMLKAAFKGFYKVLKRYGYVPGIEMLAAMEEADRLRSDIHYGDVDANETMRDLKSVINLGMLMRAMSTPPPDELRDVLERGFSSGSFGGDGGMNDLGDRVEALKTRENARKMTEWMERSMPEVATVMIHKRDKVMAANLRKHCSVGKVLAVVGLAHVDGIEREWERLNFKSTTILSPT